ncbi:transmembrane protein, putative (macronuclear) [Tetrahymena thermophila SB210]|uniref:Transmembrane protein, putative n=1 Tax=Tetrahymena thermophila (strain SB210) TaxID=312017 RepID=Q22BW1_TETTS|nr:transmembrane protein, putative [Tetrahymena thermophila SB210]EAR82797.1 transmembrane protein, putative [Tetrahymena thermophila SB210]|eukprot:XP_001030460.1 transmembrane protein, putative [Tetrahymena thermophila SB210]
MSNSFYKQRCGRIINIAPIGCKQHQRALMFQYLRMLILTIIYLAILVRNFISKKYDVNDYQNYLLFIPPALFFTNWICDRLFFSKRFDIDFSPLIIIYFIVPYVAICRNNWQSDTLSYSILMIWSINIVFSRSQVASFLGCAIGLFALIYQGWYYDYHEIIVGIGFLSCFLNWELNKQQVGQKLYIQQISKKVETKYLQNQKQIKMIVEVDKNYNPTNQKTNDIKLLYISSNDQNEQFFGSIDPIPFIRNCWVSSKKKKSFLQQLITSHLESKNQVSSTFKVRYVKGIKPVMINASLTEQEELELIQLDANQENQQQKQNIQTQSASKSEINFSNALSNSVNQTIKFTFLVNQEIEERQYWKFCQKYQQKLLQNILRKSMVNMQKIVNILSPN